MKKHIQISTAIIALTFTHPLSAESDPFADRVVHFEPGSGFATDFGTGAGLTNVVSAIGGPALETPGEFGGPTTPFAPPFLAEHLLSIGEAGSAIFEFDPPVFNHPANPFGLDFIIYGNVGFSITNGNFTGGGITDGSTFGQNNGSTQIFVSEDNQTFFQLDPSLAPTADHYYPTDAHGAIGIPVDPNVTPNDFAAADLAGIRTLYKGSAGGTSYDLSWARNDEGTPVHLDWVRYVRIDVIEGKSEIDAIASVQPSAPATISRVHETFATNPENRGWQESGNDSLFSWDESNQHLQARWDSSQPNSYFYLPLGADIGTGQSFNLAFDLTLNAIEIGTTEMKPFTFPIAIGLIDLGQATREDYFRGTGIHAEHGPRGVVEWNYLPDSGFGATVSSGLISQDNQWAFQNSFPLELKTDVHYQISLAFDATAGSLTTTMTADGEPFGPLKEANLNDIFGGPIDGEFTNLNVNTLAISSYSDEGQSPPEFAGSIQAEGSVDNIIFSLENDLSIDRLELAGDETLIHFNSQNGTVYWLEASHDVENWFTVDQLTADTTGPAQFSQPIEEGMIFYRLSSKP